MITSEQKSAILDRIPHQTPFRFIDDILDVDEDGARGVYTYRKDEFFYKGHFPDNPITPGVILTETMAQIGLLPLGIYLLNGTDCRDNILFSSSEVRFCQIVYAGQTVTVESRKRYFRHNILKCDVKMFQESRGLVCYGTLCGLFLPQLSEGTLNTQYETSSHHRDGSGSF
jgi:3-hydroxyacyl-[acyl-carrier-protein] dehydratase